MRTARFLASDSDLMMGMMGMGARGGAHPGQGREVLRGWRRRGEQAEQRRGEATT